MTKADIEELTGDFLVTLLPTFGRRDRREVRMRISRIPRDPLIMQGRDGTRTSHPFPIQPGLAHLPPVFEIINGRTGEPDDAASLDFSVEGAGVTVESRVTALRFDGFNQSLHIHNLDSSGFSGSYAAGVFGDDEFGVFCARRVTPE